MAQIFTNSSLQGLLDDIKQNATHDIQEIATFNFGENGEMSAAQQKRLDMIAAGKQGVERQSLVNLIKNAPTLAAAAEQVASSWLSMGADSVEYVYDSGKQTFSVVPVFRGQKIQGFANTVPLEDKKLNIRRGSSQGTQALVAVKVKNGQGRESGAYALPNVETLSRVSESLFGDSRLHIAIDKYQEALELYKQTQEKKYKTAAEVYKTEAKAIMSVITKDIAGSVRQDSSGTGDTYINAKTAQNRRIALGTVNYAPYFDRYLNPEYLTEELQKAKSEMTSRQVQQMVQYAMYSGDISGIPSEVQNIPAVRNALQIAADFYSGGVFANGTGEMSFNKKIATVYPVQAAEASTGRKFAQINNVRDLSEGSVVKRKQHFSNKEVLQGSYITQEESNDGVTTTEASKLEYKILQVPQEIIDKYNETYGTQLPSVANDQLVLFDSVRGQFEAMEPVTYHYTKKEIQGQRKKQLESLTKSKSELLKQQEAIRKKREAANKAKKFDEAAKLRNEEAKIKRKIKSQEVRYTNIDQMSNDDYQDYFLESLKKKYEGSYYYDKDKEEFILQGKRLSKDKTGKKLVMGGDSQGRYSAYFVSRQGAEISQMLKEAGYSDEEIQNAAGYTAPNSIKEANVHNILSNPLRDITQSLRGQGFTDEWISQFFNGTPYAGFETFDGNNFIRNSDWLNGEEGERRFKETFTWLTDLKKNLAKRLKEMGETEKAAEEIAGMISGHFKGGKNGQPFIIDENGSFIVGYGTQYVTLNPQDVYDWAPFVTPRTSKSVQQAFKVSAAKAGVSSGMLDSLDEKFDLSKEKKTEQQEAGQEVADKIRESQWTMHEKMPKDATTVGWGSGYDVNFEDYMDSYDGEHPNWLDWDEETGKVTEDSWKNSPLYAAIKLGKSNIVVMAPDGTSYKFETDVSKNGKKKKVEAKGISLVTSDFSDKAEDVGQTEVSALSLMSHVFREGVLSRTGASEEEQERAHEKGNEAFARYWEDVYNSVYDSHTARGRRLNTEELKGSKWGKSIQGGYAKDQQLSGTILVHPDDLREMILEEFGTTDKLTELEKYLYEGDDNHQFVDANNYKTPEELKKALLDSIIRAVDISDSEFASRLDRARFLDKLIRLIPGLALRHPLLGAFSQGGVRLLTDTKNKDLQRNSFMMEGGLADYLNADYDGDTVAVLTHYFGSNLSQDRDKMDLYMARMASAQKQNSKQESVSRSFDMSMVKALGGKYQNYMKALAVQLKKQFTGYFDNPRQTMMDFLADAKLETGQDTVLGGFFEDLSQEPISSKKMIFETEQVKKSMTEDEFLKLSPKEVAQRTASAILPTMEEFEKLIMEEDIWENEDKLKHLKELAYAAGITEGDERGTLANERTAENLLQALYIQLNDGKAIGKLTDVEKETLAKKFSNLLGREVTADMLDDGYTLKDGLLKNMSDKRLRLTLDDIIHVAQSVFGPNAVNNYGDIMRSGPRVRPRHKNAVGVAWQYGENDKVSNKGGVENIPGVWDIDGSLTINAKGSVILKGDVITKERNVGPNGELIGHGTTLTNTPPTYQSVTDRAKMVAGGIGRPTSSPYGHISGKIAKAFAEIKAGTKQLSDFAYKRSKRKGESDQDYAAVPGMTNLERAKYFGYSKVKDFEADKDSILATERGTYAGAASEALGRAKLLGYNFKSIAELRNGAVSDPKLQAIYDSFKQVWIHYQEILSILGYHGKEFDSEVTGGLQRGETHYKDLIGRIEAKGGSLAGVEMKGHYVDDRGTWVSGRTDAEYFVPTEDRNGKLRDSYVITDFKTTDGEITPQYIAQLAQYQEMRRRQQQEIQNAYTESGDKGIRTWAIKNAWEFGIDEKQLSRKEYESAIQRVYDWAKRLKDVNSFQIELQSVNSSNESKLNRIGEMPADIVSAILQGESLTSEQIARAMGQVSSTAITGGSKRKKGGKTGSSHSRPGSMGSTPEERANNINAYFTHLREVYSLELKIYKLRKESEYAASIGETGRKKRAEEQIVALEKLRDAEQKAANYIEWGNEEGEFYTDKNGKKHRKGKNNFTDEENKQKQEFLKKKEIAENADKKEVDAKDAADREIETEREIETSLQKRLSLESKILAERKTIGTSAFGKEKEALAQLIGMQEKEVSTLDEKIKRLVDSGKYRKEELERITREYRQGQLTRQAEVAARDHGSMSIFDKIKYDVKRSMMRIMDYGISMRLMQSIPRGLSKIYQLTIQLDNAITSLRVVTGMNRKEAEATLITYQKLGKQLGATTQEVAQSATTWLRQGYSVEEAGNLIDASMKLSKLGFMQADQATQTLTAALKGFKLEVSSAMDVVDKFTQMDQKAAVSAQGVSEALSLMANSARLAGLDLNQAIAMVSTVGEVTQQSMSTVGNAMKTMLARFGNVKAGAFADMSEGGEETENINDIEKVLKALGISIRSSAGEMREFDDVLADVADKWVTLDSVSKNAISGALGGVRQREAVVTLLENYDRFIELTKESEESVGAANEKYKAYTDSLEASLKRLTDSWEKFTQQVQASPIAKFGVKFLTLVVDNMSNIVTLMATLGGQLLAMKMPAWLNKFYANNIGGGKVGSFLGGMLGGNEGFVGKRVKAAKMAAFDKETLLLQNKAVAPIYSEMFKKTAKVYALEKEMMADEKQFSLDLKRVEARKRAINDSYTRQQSELESEKQSKLSGLSGSIFSRKRRGPRKKLNNEYRLRLEELKKKQDEKLSGYEAEEKSIKEQASAAKEASRKRSNVRRFSMLEYSNKTKTAVKTTRDKIAKNRAAEKAKKEKNGDFDFVREHTRAYEGDKLVNSSIEEGNMLLDKIFLLLRKKLLGENVTDDDFAEVEKKHTDALKKDTEQKQKWSKTPKGQQVLGAVGAGVTSAVFSGMTKTTVGDGPVDSLWNKTGQTTEADTADKVIKGATSGVLAGVGTYFLGPLGGMLGNAVGGAAGDLISYLRHADELKMKQRVEEAKKQLESLNELKNSINNISPTLGKAIWNSEDVANVQKYIQEMTTALNDNAGFLKFFLKILKENNEELSKLPLNEILEKLLEGSLDEKKDVNNALTLATLKQTREEKIAANEEETNNLQELSSYRFKLTSDMPYGEAALKTLKSLEQQGAVVGVEEGYNTANIAGDSWQERLENTRLTIEALKKESEAFNAKRVISELEEYAKMLEEEGKKSDSHKNEIRQLNVQIGMASSGVSSLSLNEQQALGFEGVVQKVADAMEAEGISVRDLSGHIRKEYLPLINSAIKGNENLTAVVRGHTDSVRYLTKSYSKLDEVLDIINDNSTSEEYDWKSLKELVDFATPKNIKILEDLARKAGLTKDELRGLVYASDHAKMQNIAEGLYMTEESLKGMGLAFQNISTGFVAEASLESVREMRDGYKEIYDDILETGYISETTMEKIVSKYPELISAMDAGGRELKDTLQEMLFGRDNRGFDRLYGQIAFSQRMNSSDYFKESSSNLKAIVNKVFSDISKNNPPQELLDLKDRWNGADTYEKAFAVLNNSTFKNLVKDNSSIEAELNKIFSGSIKIQGDTSDWDRYIEYQKDFMSEQIDNLTEQKDMLSKINEEREKELNLMKKQEALENAKKEKKRVYRAGVGFVYEADEEAISSAKKELDEVEISRQQENLQMEIDRLNLEKEILEYIPTVEEQQELKEDFDEWAAKMGEVNGSLTSWADTLSSVYTKFVELDYAGLFEEYKKQVEERKQQRTFDVSEAYGAFLTAEKKLNESTSDKNSLEYNTLVDNYNTSLSKFQDVVKKAQDKGVDVEDIKSALNGKLEDKRKKGEAVEEGEVADAVSKDLKASKKHNEAIMVPLEVMEDKGVGKASGNFYMSDDEVIKEDLEKQFSNLNTTWFKFPETENGNLTGKWKEGYTSLEDWNKERGTLPRIQTTADFAKYLPRYTIIGNNSVDDYFMYIDGNGELRWMNHEKFVNGESLNRANHAKGALDIGTDEDYSIINELGTEGIVTPQGTFTALPSHTGIVPADITKNVWKLGEVAPTLIAQLGSLRNPELQTNGGNTTNNDGMFIDQLNMTVYPTKDYDMEKFLTEAKAKARITRHNN